MRTKLVAGNWKMHMTVAEGASLARGVVAAVGSPESVDVVVCPPFLAIPAVKEVTKDTPVKVGAQDVFWMDEGAFTGKVSPKMLADLCVDYCIVGHSETRGRFGKLDVPESTIGHFAETDETVNLKIRALIRQGIVPLLCVGESLAERQAGQTEAVVHSQIKGALDGIEPGAFYTIVVAYEPVWAIGTGETCDAIEANRVCRHVRTVIGGLVGSEAADSVRVLYGGSVKASNAGELFSQSDIDGGLVGGASLDAAGFGEIVTCAS